MTGPLTAEAPRPLPADMEAFVHSAGEAGFVFASLGTTGLAGEQCLRLATFWAAHVCLACWWHTRQKVAALHCVHTAPRMRAF